MATEVTSDLSLIQDEDVLRKMWSQADDYDRKKEIRLRMYKLREQRLKAYYTGETIKEPTPARKHASITHADSISDQGFMTVKSKEIRDSESPTRDVHHTQGNEKYWTTVQDTTSSTTGDDKNFVKTYGRTSDAKAFINDNTQVQVSAKEHTVHSESSEVTDNSSTKRGQLNQQAALVSQSETVGPNGEFVTSKSEQEESNSSSFKTTNSKFSSGYSQKWESSSSSSSSSKRVYSSNSTRENAIENITTGDWKAITSESDALNRSRMTNLDETDFRNSEFQSSNQNTSRDFKTVETSQIDKSDLNYSTHKTHSRAKEVADTNTYFSSNREVPFDDINEGTTYETSTNFNVASKIKNKNTSEQVSNISESHSVVEENILNELNKLDTYLSNEHLSKTSSSKVVKNNDKSFENTKVTTPTESSTRKGIVKYPSSLDLPKETADNQYVTTYQQSYQRISVDNSPTHNAFATSLRASPDKSPNASPSRPASKGPSDRSSPERKYRTSPTRGSPERKIKTSPTRSSPEQKFRTSPTRKSPEWKNRTSPTQPSTEQRFTTSPTRSIYERKSGATPTAESPDRNFSSPVRKSPEKDRRTSVGSYTIESPRSPVRKTSDATVRTSNLSASKQKRKFSSTQTKESSKKRASTPSASPSASPTSQMKDTHDSPVTSDNDSDASQATYSKSPINVRETFESTTSLVSEQTKKSSLKQPQGNRIKSPSSEKGFKSPERTSPSRAPVIEETIIPEKAYLECGLNCDETIDITISLKPNKPESPAPVSETPFTNEKTYFEEETYKKETNVTKVVKSQEPEPAAYSPVFNNVRDKSPEYSSEGSVGKEVKRVRSPVKNYPDSNHSSPERSAFAPIKQFRTSPEIKKAVEPTYPSEQTRKVSDVKSPKAGTPSSPVQVGPKKFTSPKTSSPTRSVSSSASPASSPERVVKSRINLTDSKTIQSEVTEVTQSTQETRINRKTSATRADSKSSLIKKPSEKSIKEKPAQGSKIPSSTDLRNSSLNRKTTRTVESITVTKKPAQKTTEISKTPQKSTTTGVKSVKTTASIMINNKNTPRYGNASPKTVTNTVSKSRAATPKYSTNTAIPNKRVSSKTEINIRIAPTKRIVQKKNSQTDEEIVVEKSFKTQEPPKRPKSPLKRPTQTQEITKTNSMVALQLICAQDNTTKSKAFDSFDYDDDIDDDNLEDETPPDDFTLEDTTPEIKTTKTTTVTKTISAPKTVLKKTVTEISNSQTVKSDNKYTRSSSDKIVSKIATPKRQVSKPEIPSNTNRTPGSKTIPVKATTTKKSTSEKVMTTKNVTTVNSTPKKPILKKSSKDSIKEKDYASSSSSSSEDDELNDVSIRVNSSDKEQKYIEELDEMRRQEETEYASKVISTKNKDSSLLSVIVQLPSSSRESSPDYANRGQIFATVSDDGGDKPRYADRVSEPDDSDVNQKVKTKELLLAETRLYEQVTDLDEDSEEEEEEKIDVSVADRVSKFLETAKISNTTTTSTIETQSSATNKDKSVLKAKAMFENIAKSQTSTPAPSKQPTDIYKPSIVDSSPIDATSEPSPKVPQSPTKIYDRRRSSINTEDVALASDSLSRKQSSNSIKSDVTKSSQIISEEIVVDVKENKKIVPLERKESAYSTDYKSRKNFFEQKAATPTRKVQNTPRATPKPLSKQWPDNKSTPISELRKSPEKDTNNHRKPSLRDSPEKDIVTVRKSSIKDSADKENVNVNTIIRKNSVEKNVSLKQKSTVSRKSPEKDTPFTRRESLNKKPSDKDLPTAPVDSPRKSPERESSLFKPTVASSVRSSTPKKSIEGPVGLDRQPSSNELPRNTRKSPEKSIVRTTKSLSERRSIFEKGTEKTPVKPVSEFKHSKTTKTEVNVSSAFIENEKKTVEKTPSSNEISPVKAPEQKPANKKNSLGRISPDRKAPSPDRKASSPDRKASSPDRKASSPDRKASSPDRKAPLPQQEKKSPTEPEQRYPTEPLKKTSVTSQFDRKGSFSTTVQRDVLAEVSDNRKANKFGVSLRRTPSQTSPSPTAKPVSAPSNSSSDKQEIEDIFDVELLERMMEVATKYDDRRRLRAQIRLAKRKGETITTTTKTTSVTTISGANSKTTPKTHITEKVEVVTSTPSSGESSKKTKTSQTTREVKSEITTSVRSSSPSKQTSEPTKRAPSEKEAVPNYETKKTVESKKEVVEKNKLEKRPSGETNVQRTDSFNRSATRTESSYEYSVTSKSSSQKTYSTETKEVSGTDLITSSYGVGPTDDNGLPLFGLKALRRSNTGKTLITDEVSSTTTATDAEIRDSSGKPLFGLRAVQSSSGQDSDMPEQPVSPQLKDLVQRHEKHARDSSTSETLPRQKPKAKLRDSFVLQSQDEEELAKSISNIEAEEASSSQRSLSLKSIIKKHDGVPNSGGEVHEHSETRRTVVSSQGTINPDGTVSMTRNVIQGKISSVNGEEPSGSITSTQYQYHAPSIHEKGKTETVTATTVLGQKRLSGPRVTEAINDDQEEKNSTVKKYISRRSSSGLKISEILENGTSNEKDSELSKTYRRLSNNFNQEDFNSSRRRSSNFDDGQDSQDGKFSKKSEESSLNSILKKSSSGNKFNVATSSTVTTSTSQRVSSTNGLHSSFENNEENVRRSSVESEKKKPTLVRGDSIKALQHKFQQATVSSSLKHTSVANLKNRSSSNSLDTSKTISPKTSQPIESNVTTVKTTENFTTKSKTENSSSGPTSFLDNKSRVTGVQDILERMRNADLVTEAGESTEDQEARSLLNKFLGASVILQGMEQGMKAVNGRVPISNNSATLVNRVEKQRVLASGGKTRNLSEIDLEKIWDEQQLRNLLESCTDYEERRKIRARLRTVMAEHKACGDVTALVSNSAGADATMTQDCSESSSVSTKTEGNSTIHSEVHTRTTTSTARLTKSGSVASSPFAKFRQLERQHSAPSSGSARAPIYKITDPKLMNSAATIKERLLSWVKAQTKEYKNIQIENFSSSWSNGLAFCALIHHFCPNAFDYDKLTPEDRRYNFELAFRVAEEEAGIAPLLDVEDMVIMRRPDWKCVFTYVQSIYRTFHKSDRAVLVFNF